MNRTASTSSRTAADYLGKPLTLGDPDTCGSLAVYPIWGPTPSQQYVSFFQGRQGGVAIRELEGAASVNDLLVVNPTDRAVLLLEGEEVLGAQQNRGLNVTALIAANSQQRIPVSCVEAGRWDSRRHRESFTPSQQTASAELRRSQAIMASDSLAAGGPARRRQDEVWKQIEAKRMRLGAFSPTGAMHDIYEGRRDQLDRFNDAIRLRDGQSGVLVAIGGSFVVLDWVSRPEVFASLHGPLVQGYALDAIEHASPKYPSDSAAEAFVRSCTQSPVDERPGIGLGDEIRFSSQTVVGAGLASDGELVQISAHQL